MSNSWGRVKKASLDSVHEAKAAEMKKVKEEEAARIQNEAENGVTPEENVTNGGANDENANETNTSGKTKLDMVRRMVGR